MDFLCHGFIGDGDGLRSIALEDCACAKASREFVRGLRHSAFESRSDLSFCRDGTRGEEVTNTRALSINKAQVLKVAFSFRGRAIIDLLALHKNCHFVELIVDAVTRLIECGNNSLLFFVC